MLGTVKFAINYFKQEKIKVDVLEGKSNSLIESIFVDGR